MVENHPRIFIEDGSKYYSQSLVPFLREIGGNVARAGNHYGFVIPSIRERWQVSLDTFVNGNRAVNRRNLEGPALSISFTGESIVVRDPDDIFWENII